MKSLTTGKLLTVVLWIIWFSACTPVAVQTQPTTEVKISTLLDTAPAEILNPTSPSPAAIDHPTDLPSIPDSTSLPTENPSNPLIPVTIHEPEDDAVVQDSLILIKGEANPGTVLSINDEIVLVDTTRKFIVPIQLEEGLNILEIIASDEQGNQESQYLSITYEPQ